jgi:dTDP-4-dehydrorhamnose reductase
VSDVLLFGATSMLGWSILRARGDAPVVAFCNAGTKMQHEEIREGVDLDDEPAVAALFARVSPRLIINCAGVCDVGTCEESPDFAHTVNVEGTRVLLAHAPAQARIVHCSSDHVFSGDTGPYTEDSPPDPISVYGRTRVAAEQLVAARERTLIVRAGLWVGPSSTGRIGHLDWLRDRTKRQLPMTIVSDEHRSAVWAEDAARRVWELARSELTGVRHIVATRIVARPALATYLDRHFAIGATFAQETRAARKAPHLGKLDLRTKYRDALAAPLPSVIPDEAVAA